VLSYSFKVYFHNPFSVRASRAAATGFFAAVAVVLVTVVLVCAKLLHTGKQQLTQSYFIHSTYLFLQSPVQLSWFSIINF
jgi:hypothetical protein